MSATTLSPIERARTMAEAASSAVVDLEYAAIDMAEGLQSARDQVAAIEARYAAQACEVRSLSNDAMRKAWIADALASDASHADLKRSADLQAGELKRLEARASEARRLFQIALATYQKIGGAE